MGHSPWGFEESDMTEQLTLSLFTISKTSIDMMLFRQILN